ncbi:MAG: 3-deoxy-D-manno-octulosonic acid transferase, partial [Magnetococcales bacterium]|nr:3-deoxy-D-manno-octulosonic acid transferase [Magnetococcales bacterium]
MLILLYNLLLLLVILLVTPLLVWKYATTPKYSGTVLERLGFGSSPPARSPEKPLRIWIHAVSVGETITAGRLVDALVQRYPEAEILFSTVTKTGRAVARSNISPANHHFYLPADLTPIVNRVVSRIDPDLVIIMETELWPALFHTLGKRRIPIVLVNGRLSENSFRSYHRFRWAMKPILQPVARFIMQSEADAQRMLSLIGTDDNRVVSSGNLKYEQATHQPSEQEITALRNRLGLEKRVQESPLWTVASTHPGEEEAILEAFALCRSSIPDLRLILTPRHPERGSDVETLCRRAGFDTQRYSDCLNRKQPWRSSIVIIDAVGVLRSLYALSTLVTVGGSLVPKGGQNILEPAAAGKVAVFGPHMANFRHATQTLL